MTLLEDSRNQNAKELSPKNGGVNLKHKVHNIGVAQQIARYSDAIKTNSHLRWLHPSGTPGLTETGELPKDITSQTWLVHRICDIREIQPGHCNKLIEMLQEQVQLNSFVMAYSECFLALGIILIIESVTIWLFVFDRWPWYPQDSAESFIVHRGKPFYLFV